MGRFRSVITDSIAMLLFTTVACASIETGVAGMTLAQTLQARLAAVPLNLISGRPYGLYRDCLIGRLASPFGIRLALVETLIFTSFQIPLYLLVLMFAGADAEQMVASSAAMILLFGVLGRAYGVFLDKFRALLLGRSTC